LTLTKVEASGLGKFTCTSGGDGAGMPAKSGHRVWCVAREEAEKREKKLVAFQRKSWAESVHEWSGLVHPGAAREELSVETDSELGQQTERLLGKRSIRSGGDRNLWKKKRGSGLRRAAVWEKRVREVRPGKFSSIKKWIPRPEERAWDSEDGRRTKAPVVHRHGGSHGDVKKKSRITEEVSVGY